MWTDKRRRGINQYHECQFIRLEGSSDGEMSNTNLFNSLILHFNPSLIPSLFRSGCLSMPAKEEGERDSKQRKRGFKTELKLGGLKRRKEQIPDREKKGKEKQQRTGNGRFMEHCGTLPLQVWIYSVGRWTVRDREAIKRCRWELRTNWYDHNMSH